MENAPDTSEVPESEIAAADKIMAEAHRSTQPRPGEIFPDHHDVKNRARLLKLQAAADRGISAAARLLSKLTKLDAEKAAAEKEQAELIAMENQRESLAASRKVALDQVAHADQTLELLRDYVEATRLLIVKSYSGVCDGGTVPNIIEAYSQIAAANDAIEDFPTIREEIEGDVERIDKQIAALEAKQAAFLKNN